MSAMKRTVESLLGGSAIVMRFALVDSVRVWGRDLGLLRRNDDDHNNRTTRQKGRMRSECFLVLCVNVASCLQV